MVFARNFEVFLVVFSWSKHNLTSGLRFASLRARAIRQKKHKPKEKIVKNLEAFCCYRPGFGQWFDGMANLGQTVNCFSDLTKSLHSIDIGDKLRTELKLLVLNLLTNNNEIYRHRWNNISPSLGNNSIISYVNHLTEISKNNSGLKRILTI